MSFLIHQIREGEIIRLGLNWTYRTKDSNLRLVLRIWRFSWYFRIRNSALCKYPNTNKRIVFHFDISKSWIDGYEQIFRGFEYNWQRRVFRIEGCIITEEYLFDVVKRLSSER